MKRKIIALVLVLSLVPSVILGASTKYTKTEKVIYNPIKVSIDGTEVSGTIKIGNKTYVNLSELSVTLNKGYGVNENGDVNLEKLNSKYGFAKGSWGDSLNDIIKLENRKPDKEWLGMQGYVINKYGINCIEYYGFDLDYLSYGLEIYEVTDKNYHDVFELLCDKLYDQYETLVSKSFNNFPNSPDVILPEEALKKGYANLTAEFNSKNGTAYLKLDTDDNRNFRVTIAYGQNYNN